MAAVIEYFRHVDTINIGPTTFYGFEVQLANPTWNLVLYLLDPDAFDAALPLRAADIPLAIPSIIYEDTAIDESFTAPTDLYYAFARVTTFHDALKPSPPIEANVIISQAFFDSAVCYYADRPPDGDMQLPVADNPDTHATDANGWYYPPYEDFGFLFHIAANRNVTFQLAALDWRLAWIYDGCTFDPLHVMEELDEAVFNLEGTYTWTSAKYVECCNTGSGTGYLIEEGATAGSEWAGVWLFESDSENPARHYAPGLLLPGSKVNPLPGIVGALTLLALIAGDSLPFVVSKFARLSAHTDREVPLGIKTASSGNFPLGASDASGEYPLGVKRY